MATLKNRGWRDRPRLSSAFGQTLRVCDNNGNASDCLQLTNHFVSWKERTDSRGRTGKDQIARLEQILPRQLTYDRRGSPSHLGDITFLTKLSVYTQRYGGTLRKRLPGEWLDGSYDSRLVERLSDLPWTAGI